MERITINIPDSQSEEIKSFLKSKGIVVDSPKSLNIEAYQKKIANIGVWTDEDLKLFDDNRKLLDNFNPQEW
ncbi:hypothetical protein [Mucilaginibacter paludis]|uniref:Uncharacterized protein n=1 Tax=Mucilaginibacter paludis DSM 18603 TaxID=714943 RepID=H1YI52_9SPHI|nr:hypothetical protein [Mucilaginibacter paludis]EHQ26487.1 hypothetical protein Mucpa_2357 [Mucilaginibacter paludis DSM 18603]